MVVKDFISRSITDDLIREFPTSYDVVVTPRVDYYDVEIVGSLIGGTLIDFVRVHYSPATIVITPSDGSFVKLSFNMSCTKD